MSDNPLSVALAAASKPTNPMDMAQSVMNMAKTGQDIRTGAFNLQQAQLQPAYMAMRQLAMTNQNPSDDDVNAALGGAARISQGGSQAIDGLVQNYTDWRARGGTAKDFVRAYGIGGMSPENQALMGIGQPATVETPQGILMGMRGGPLSAAPGQFTLQTGIAKGLSPEQWAQPIQVWNPQTQSYTMQPAGQAWGYPMPPGLGGGAGGQAPAVGGGNTGGAPGAGVGGSALLPPGAPADVAAARIDQIAQRESGNQNIPTGIKNPDGTPASSASGPYQFLDRTWQQAAREYGIPNPTPRAMDTDPAIQRAVAIKFLQTHGEGAWATSAPGGGGQPGQVFIGASSAQPVVGGGIAQPGGANVRPAGGPQYLDPMGRPMAPGGAVGAPGGGFRSLPMPAPGQVQSLETAADASSKQYAADNAAAGQFQQRVWPLVQAANILDKNAPTTGQGAEAVRSIIGHLQTLGNIFSGGDITNIGQSKFEELGKYMQQAVNASPFAASSNDKLAAAITGSPNTHMTNLANQDVLKAMIGLERMKQMAITDFNNQGGQPMNWSNFMRQWQTSHDPRAFVFDMLPADKRRQLVDSMKSPAERTNFANTLSLVENNPGVMTRPAMP